ncbi:unnamed protein product, partial [Musa acuminata subsp. burmannicoides]
MICSIIPPFGPGKPFRPLFWSVASETPEFNNIFYENL